MKEVNMKEVKLRFGRIITTKKAFDELIDDIDNIEVLEDFLGCLIDGFRIRKKIPTKQIIRLLRKLLRVFFELERERR